VVLIEGKSLTAFLPFSRIESRFKSKENASILNSAFSFTPGFSQVTTPPLILVLNRFNGFSRRIHAIRSKPGAKQDWETV